MKDKLIMLGILVFGTLFLVSCNNVSNNNSKQIEGKDSVTYINNDNEEDLELLEIDNREITETNSGADAASVMISSDDVSSHNNKDDCWIVIDAKVYNVTEFISSHPGGKAILQGCGKDATDLYNTKPGSGSTHSSKARNMLEDYYIGDLAK